MLVQLLSYGVLFPGGVPSLFLVRDESDKPAVDDLRPTNGAAAA